MLHIGIITYYFGSENYGGLLQAYALQSFLNSQGYDSVQICYSKGKTDITSAKRISNMGNSEGIGYIIKRMLRKVRNTIRSLLYALEGNMLNVAPKIDERKNAVARFRNDRILHTVKVYNEASIDECTEFDAFICGSDQIWSDVTSYNDLDRAYWLRFVPSTKKKISYAASISRSKIPISMQSKVKEALVDFDGISVREEKDKKNIEEIISKPVNWVLDPTLLLKRSDWEKVAKDTPYKGERYIFAYLLGDKRKDRSCIKRFAKVTGCKIITIPYLMGEYRPVDRFFGDIQYCNVSPEEWMTLIHDAQYVFTDSFHGTVFSILFNKPFYTFKRDNDHNKSSMNNRIYSLLDLFGLSERLITGEEDPEQLLALSPIGYDQVMRVLEEERTKSKEYLMNALK